MERIDAVRLALTELGDVSTEQVAAFVPDFAPEFLHL
jgi:hypothetical protein